MEKEQRNSGSKEDVVENFNNNEGGKYFSCIIRV